MNLKAQAVKPATIPFDKALDEVNKWLDHKALPISKREVHKDNIDSLANAISDGYVTIKEDKKLEHTLLKPIKNDDGEVTVTTLEYKSDLNTLEIDPWIKGIKSDDVFGLLIGHICALTLRNKNIIKRLDTVDLSLARTIAGFFFI